MTKRLKNPEGDDLLCSVGLGHGRRVDMIRAPGWLRYAWLRHGFSTRVGGVSTIYNSGAVNKPSNGALKWQDNVFTAPRGVCRWSYSRRKNQAKLLPYDSEPYDVPDWHKAIVIATITFITVMPFTRRPTPRVRRV